MARYISKPSEIEAVQWTGDNNVEIIDFGVQTLMHQRDGVLRILAGKEGAQKYVPVPVGHWIVHPPGDLSDVWPVDPDYFAKKYKPVESPPPSEHLPECAFGSGWPKREVGGDPLCICEPYRGGNDERSTTERWQSFAERWLQQRNNELGGSSDG